MEECLSDGGLSACRWAQQWALPTGCVVLAPSLSLSETHLQQEHTPPGDQLQPTRASCRCVPKKLGEGS